MASSAVSEGDGAAPVEGRMAVVTQFVQQAFQERAMGDSTNFTYIVRQLSVTTSRVSLRRWLRALTQSASLIHQRDADLVEAVLRLPWPLEDVQFGNSFMDFLENLLSANAYFAVPSLQMLVLNLTYSMCTVAANDDGFGYKESTMLYAVTRIVPMAVTVLSRCIRDHFPHKRQSMREHAWYMRNLFRLLEYVPELMSEVLSVVVEHILQIDEPTGWKLINWCQTVQKRRFIDGKNADAALSDETMDNVDDAEDEPLMFDVEIEADLDMVDEDAGPVATMDPAVLRRAMLRAANKLDTVLQIVFEYLDKCMQEMSRGDQEQLLTRLLHIFEQKVMQTHGSRYTQYIIFYFVCLRRDFPDAFLAMLPGRAVENQMSILYDTNKNTHVRQSAAAYIASFISRCRQVTANTVRLSMDRLRAWLDGYMNALELNVEYPDVRRYPLFYYPAQALMYIFCFRHEQLMSMPDGAEYVNRLDFPRLINSRFNPLKVCVASIVQEFGRLAKRYEIMYCDLIIAQNRALVLPKARDARNMATPPSAGRRSPSALVAVGPETDLEAFFMFEPYALQRTSPFVKKFYQEWTGRALSTNELGSVGEGSQTDEGPEDGDDASNDASMISSESLEHALLFQLHPSPSSFQGSPY